MEAREIHTPLVTSSWGVDAINRMYVNETRYVYHDCVSTPMRHGLSFADIEHEEWVQSAHDQFCEAESCKNYRHPEADSVRKMAAKAAKAIAGADVLKTTKTATDDDDTNAWEFAKTKNQSLIPTQTLPTSPVINNPMNLETLIVLLLYLKHLQKLFRLSMFLCLLKMLLDLII